MTTREYGEHFKLNHKQSNSIIHKNEYNTKLEKHTIKAMPIQIPTYFSLASKYKLNILDQGNLGSCVVNSLCGIIQSVYKITPSRLYYYFNARIGSGTSPTEDSGLDLLQSYPLFQSYGIVPEANWVYNINNFSIMPPLAKTYKIASVAPLIKFENVQQTDANIKSALLANKFIMLGISVYSSFMTASVSSTGIIPMPDTTTETNEGGHCIHIVGWCIYNNIPCYIIRNSWGTSWGNNGNPIPTPNFINNGSNGGFGYIPQAYITNTELAFELLAVS